MTIGMTALLVVINCTGTALQWMMMGEEGHLLMHTVASNSKRYSIATYCLVKYLSGGFLLSLSLFQFSVKRGMVHQRLVDDRVRAEAEAVWVCMVWYGDGSVHHFLL